MNDPDVDVLSNFHRPKELAVAGFFLNESKKAIILTFIAILINALMLLFP